MITDYDYVFSENGLVAYKEGALIAEQVRELTAMCSFVYNSFAQVGCQPPRIM